VKEHAPQILHTMLRVRDLPLMLDFYCNLLGMRELRRLEFPEARYSLIFVGYGETRDAPQIELWHMWDRTVPYGPDEAFGHVGIGVTDIAQVCARLRAAGVPVLREPAPMRPGGRVIALIRDPEGHEVELLAAD